MRLKVLPPYHEDIGHSLSKIGEIYENLHKSILALDYYQQALTIYEKCLPSGHDDLWIMKSNIERLSEELGIELD
ncbi:unnamed protein product [Rotaria sp. Silwood1]|nr:unnamed protein product [Rotaria sp. Silwood1]